MDEWVERVGACMFGKQATMHTGLLHTLPVAVHTQQSTSRRARVCVSETLTAMATCAYLWLLLAPTPP